MSGEVKESERRDALADIAEYARTARCHTEDAHVLSYLDQIECWARAAVKPGMPTVGGIPVPTTSSKPVGNAAAMREALDAALPILRNCPFTHYNTTDVDAVAAQVAAALSAPPRNCDLYATAAEALNAQDVAFNESYFANGECKLGCPNCEDYTINCEVKWLFAPAKAEKGEGDGR